MKIMSNNMMIAGCAFIAFLSAVFICREAQSHGAEDWACSTNESDAMSFVQGRVMVNFSKHEDHILSSSKNHWKWENLSPVRDHWGWRPPYKAASSARLRETHLHEWVFFGAGVIVFGAIQQSLCSSLTPSVGLALWLGVGGGLTCCILWMLGREKGETWLTGYIIELLFSLDNCFVSVIIARALRVPRNHTKKAFCVLVYSQIGFDMILFLGLADWIRQCPIIPYVLGAWLIYNSCWAITVHDDQAEVDEKRDVEDSCLVRAAKAVLGARFWPRYQSDEDHAPMIVTKEGVRCLTMLPVAVLVLILVNFSLEIDVVLVKIEMFESHYLAFTSSAVAAFALPDIYLMVADFFERFQYLKYGISIILVFEGMAFLLHKIIMVSVIEQMVFVAGVMVCSMFLSEAFAEPDATRFSEAPVEPDSRSSNFPTDPPNNLDSLAADPQSADDVRCKLFWSHAITRLGTQSWLFIAPLVLLRFAPDLLIGPACWGMITMVVSMFLGPLLGTWADRSSRKTVVTLGVVSQFVAVAGSTSMLIFVFGTSGDAEKHSINVPAVAAFTVFGIIEKLGTQLSDVSVKRDWTPQLFPDGESRRRVNTVMSQIDLVTEVVGPLIAGLFITLGASVPFMTKNLPRAFHPTDFGFVAVGLLNSLSFWPQLALLLSILRSHAAYLQPKPPHELTARSGPVPPSGAWSTWLGHPCGIQFLSVSYALLYLTVLSPHGALVTAFLMMDGVSSWQLSLLRGGGALLGVMGPTVYPMLEKRMGQNATAGASVLWLAISMIVCCVAFIVSNEMLGPTRAGLLSVFMAAMCIGRPGLYAFELGVMNMAQEMADSRHRNALGAVDSALCSGATVIMYASGILWSKPEKFGILVVCSACFVTCGAVVYFCWTLFYHSHRHAHPLPGVGATDCSQGHGHGHAHLHAHVHTLRQEEALDEKCEHGHSHGHAHPLSGADANDCGHGHGHGHAHLHAHVHTMQQEEALDENGEHDHVHYNPTSCLVQ